jgi:hypothetical protein
MLPSLWGRGVAAIRRSRRAPDCDYEICDSFRRPNHCATVVPGGCSPHCVPQASGSYFGILALALPNVSSAETRTTARRAPKSGVRRKTIVVCTNKCLGALNYTFMTSGWRGRTPWKNSRSRLRTASVPPTAETPTFPAAMINAGPGVLLSHSSVSPVVLIYKMRARPS